MSHNILSYTDESEVQQQKDLMFDRWLIQNHSDEKHFPLNWRKLNDNQLLAAVNKLLDKLEQPNNSKALLWVNTLAISSRFTPLLKKAKSVERLMQIIQKNPNLENLEALINASEPLKYEFTPEIQQKLFDLLADATKKKGKNYLDVSYTILKIFCNLHHFDIVQNISKLQGFSVELYLTPVLDGINCNNKDIQSASVGTLSVSYDGLKHIMLDELHLPQEAWTFQRQIVQSGALKSMINMALHSKADEVNVSRMFDFLPQLLWSYPIEGMVFDAPKAINQWLKGQHDIEFTRNLIEAAANLAQNSKNVLKLKLDTSGITEKIINIMRNPNTYDDILLMNYAAKYMMYILNPIVLRKKHSKSFTHLIESAIQLGKKFVPETTTKLNDEQCSLIRHISGYLMYIACSESTEDIIKHQFLIYAVKLMFVSPDRVQANLLSLISQIYLHAPDYFNTTMHKFENLRTDLIDLLNKEKDTENL
jgi:hypothetical protein